MARHIRRRSSLPVPGSTAVAGSRRVRAVAAGATLILTSAALLSAAQATAPTKFSAVVLVDGRLPTGGHYRTERGAIEVDRISVRPGGHSGWHSHEGTVLLAVKRGTLVNYVSRDGRCVKTRLQAGQTLLEEPGEVHMARNEGSRDVVFVAVNNYRKGGLTAADSDRPAPCDV